MKDQDLLYSKLQRLKQIHLEIVDVENDILKLFYERFPLIWTPCLRNLKQKLDSELQLLSRTIPVKRSKPVKFFKSTNEILSDKARKEFEKSLTHSPYSYWYIDGQRGLHGYYDQLYVLPFEAIFSVEGHLVCLGSHYYNYPGHLRAINFDYLFGNPDCNQDKVQLLFNFCERSYQLNKDLRTFGILTDCENKPTLWKFADSNIGFDDSDWRTGVYLGADGLRSLLQISIQLDEGQEAKDKKVLISTGEKEVGLDSILKDWDTFISIMEEAHEKKKDLIKKLNDLYQDVREATKEFRVLETLKKSKI